MSEKLVSIIIPAYKTEKYVEQCLQSVLEQNYPNMELILVDDGSPDRCPEIFDEFAARHDGVTVIHQTNQGLGMARNAGIRAAHGEYLYMLDSDDCLDGPDAIRALMEEAERSHADVIVGNYRKFTADQVWDVNRHHLRAGDYQKTANFRFDGFYRYGHLAYNWGKLYRREFLVNNDIWCQAYPFTQDKAHNVLCHAYQPKYAFIDQSTYLYRINDESVTFRYKPDMIPVWIAIAEDFRRELKERKIPEDYGDVIAFHLFFGSFFVVKQELMAKHGFRRAKEELRRYGEEPIVREHMKALAKGKYLKEISGISWKLPIRFAAMLFAARGYFLITLGMKTLRFMRIDGMITDKRNKKIKKKDKGVTLSKDATLLCGLLREALTNVRDRDVDKLFQGKNAGSLFSMAEQHKVLPMLYDVVAKWEDEIEPAVWMMMEKTAEKTVNQSYRLLFLTKELTELFEEAGIPVVVLKGSGVASYYPVPEYRKSGDVDLLFRDAESVQRAGRLMETKGYVMTEEQHANHHLVYQGSEGIDVELHAMLAEPFDDNAVNRWMEELLPQYFEEKGTTDSMGVLLPTTSEPLQALELLLHMLQHFLRAGFGLKLLTDWVVFWNRVRDEKVAERFRVLARECGIEGFAKAITLLCEKFLGLCEVHVYGDHLEKEFSKGYAERFMMDVIQAEEFGKSDKNRMVALRRRGLLGLVKEFHYQMRMNFAEESKKKWKWPWLWVKTFVGFMKNNRRLGRGSLRSILKSANERAGVVEELKLFKKRR